MNSRLPVEKISVYVLLAIIAFIIADIGILVARASLYPKAPPEARPAPMGNMMAAQPNYGPITSKNIFNSDGKIPNPMGAEGGPGEGGKAPVDAAPIPSNLPIQLIGTIVHVNPERSVATVSLKSKNDQIAIKVNQVVPEPNVTITKIERTKVTFRNMATQRLEYIEMKDESKISFAAGKPVQNGEVTKLAENDFSLKRDDINRLTNNLPELLQQARAVPRMGPTGQIECFSMADIAAGSIYERLGLKRGDCIKSVNGERIDSPAKAMELYNALRANASTINLGIERSGRDEHFNYNITQ